MSAVDIAEARARESDDPELFMLAFAAGRSIAAKGGDEDGYIRSLTDPEAVAGFIEGVASWRVRTATARDYVQFSAARRAVAS